tara:strand:- start:2120 stop:3034 length:915 start_codon:yes stop_codon:yes gene_type:complete
MKNTLLIFIVSLLLLSACSATNSTNQTATLTASQAAALSKIHNIKGKHDSKNGSSSLNNAIKSLDSHDKFSCWKSTFEEDFKNETFEQIDCVQSIDFSEFKNESMASITTSMIVISERTDTKKRMAYYQSNEYNAWFVDPKFYKQAYYSSFSSNGSFFYDYTKSDKSAMYQILYIWDDNDGVSIDLSDITKPKLSKSITNLSFGNKDDLCYITGDIETICKIYVNAYNEETKSYDKYIARWEQSREVNNSDNTTIHTFDLMNLEDQQIGYLKLDAPNLIFSVINLGKEQFPSSNNTATTNILTQ